MNKTFPKVGDQLYLRQFTGRYYVDMVKRPYDVVCVNKTTIVVRAAELVFPVFKYNPNTMSDYYKQFDGRRVQFYNTLAESIIPNVDGKTVELVWHPKRGMWGTKGRESDYPSFAVFGKYEYYPYLD